MRDGGLKPASMGVQVGSHECGSCWREHRLVHNDSPDLLRRKVDTAQRAVRLGQRLHAAVREGRGISAPTSAGLRNKEDVQVAERVPAREEEGLLDAMVAIETDIATRGGMEYEHDQRWTRPARAREARGGEREGGIIRLAGTDRLAHIACRLDHVQAGRKGHACDVQARGAGSHWNLMSHSLAHRHQCDEPD